MDPFLLTHRVANNNHFYDLGPKLNPVSIKDQMLRGFLIADRALANNLLGLDKPLLIVGAGAAGATAALTAIKRGVPTTIIEWNDEPFNRQLFCHTRKISPTMYDWPADHWRIGKFPWRGVKFPFSWVEDYAGAIAAAWSAKLKRQARVQPDLTLLLSTRLEEPETLITQKIKGGLINVTFIEKTSGKRVAGGPFRFAVIVSCIGIGRERCYAEEGSYSGTAFWESDKLEAPDLGLPHVVAPRILLSGGGDGVLQDFLRTITICDSARMIFDFLPAQVQVEIENTVRTAEDQAQRSFVWSSTRFDCRTNHLLHNAYLQTINTILNKDYQRIGDTLEKIIRGVSGEFSLEMIHPCSHFSACYGLNRALVILISEFVRREYGIELISPCRKVTKVSSADGHDCRSQHDTRLNLSERARERSRCLSSTHTVELGLARCEQINRPGGEIFLEKRGPYDIVILRHGIKHAPDLFGPPPELNRRQMLPYYIENDWY